jgi:hypothetical protein
VESGSLLLKTIFLRRPQHSFDTIHSNTPQEREYSTRESHRPRQGIWVRRTYGSGKAGGRIYGFRVLDRAFSFVADVSLLYFWDGILEVWILELMMPDDTPTFDALVIAQVDRLWCFWSLEEMDFDAG